MNSLFVSSGLHVCRVELMILRLVFFIFLFGFVSVPQALWLVWVEMQ